jgi:uncharacterized membrane protein (UPF0127 family)
MIRTLPWLIALALAGCSPAPQVQASAPEPKQPSSTEPTAPQPPSPPQASTAKPGDNPRRIYQLREFEKGKVVVNGKTFQVWIADTDGKIQEGMMWLKPDEVKDDEGMLFLLPADEPQRFWMRNCPMALDIIFLSRDRKVLNIELGKPFDETGVSSRGPSKYVLELKAGIARKNGIRPGQTVEFQLP